MSKIILHSKKNNVYISHDPSQEIWTSENEVVKKIYNRKFHIVVEINYSDTEVIPDSCLVELEETDKEENYCHIDRYSSHSRNNYIKWGGYPDFIQGTIYPKSENPLHEVYYLCTVYDEWGDMGNNNVFLILDENKLPIGSFHEYSCS